MELDTETGQIRLVDYDEVRRPSRRPCPNCRERMIEVEMRDFGPRWQCEDCRLTVFVSGGIQPWRGQAKRQIVLP